MLLKNLTSTTIGNCPNITTCMRKAHSSALFHPESLEWEWSGLSGPFEHYTGQPSLGFPPAY